MYDFVINFSIGGGEMKKTVLALLEENADSFVSGQKIADSLNMTRANVWKEINKLRDNGYDISAVTKRGYKLQNTNKNLSKHCLSALIEKDLEIYIFNRVSSTNDFAKRLSKESRTSKLIVSLRQNKGRGSWGNNFFSPASGCIYISYLLHPQLKRYNTQRITISAALAVCDSIYDLFGIETDIKWLNDIYKDGKKLCSIQTLGDYNVKTGTHDHIIIGMGLNVCTADDIPQDQKHNYVALDSYVKDKIDHNILVATITNNLFKRLKENTKNLEKSVDDYKRKNIIIERKFKIRKSEKLYSAIDIDEVGNLVAKDGMGKVYTFNNEEIMVEGLDYEKQ